MELADLEMLIRSRRSIRSWQNKGVPASLLIKAIELATWAPNAGNSQSWRFYIILNSDTIESIANVVQTSTDLIASWPEAKEFGDTVLKWREMASFFRSAPAAVAVAATRYASVADQILAAREQANAEATRIRRWRSSANTRIQSVASAVAYLSLALHCMGLGAVWMTGPMQAKGDIEKILGVPADMDLVAFIPIGYPAEHLGPKPRRPVEEVIEIIR